MDANGQATPLLGDLKPSDGELGAFIGDQIAGVNFGLAAPAVPEPATWSLMLMGLAGALRARRPLSSRGLTLSQTQLQSRSLSTPISFGCRVQ